MLQLLTGSGSSGIVGFAVARLLAAEGDTPIPLWGQLGIAALFIAAFLTMQIVPGPLYKRLEKQLEVERAINQKHQQVWEEKVLPTMQEWAHTMRQVSDDLRKRR